MHKEDKKEIQAIMNLLSFGDDETALNFKQNACKKDSAVLTQHHGLPKCNTMHAKNSRKGLGSLKQTHQSLEQSLKLRKRSSQNKENLKNILKKLESSPSPPSKRFDLLKERHYDRIQTQISEPSSKSKSKYAGNKSLQLTKKSINTFFDKKKDKDLIKSLIKAKIMEKLKRVQDKKSEKRVHNLGLKTEPLRGLGGTMPLQPRRSVQGAGKTKSRSNFLNLLWQQKKMNNPVLSRKSSKINLRQLLI